MAFIIKNSSRYSGGAMVDGKWVSVPSGESVHVDSKPSSLSFGVKVFSVPDVVHSETGKSSSKSGTKSGNKPKAPVNVCGDSSGGEGSGSDSLTLDSSANGDLSNSAVIE